MSNKFTQKAQNTLNHALNAARNMGHTYIGSEHILLGLLEEKDSIATRLLTSKGASSKELRDAIIDISGIGSKSKVTPSDMTPRAKKIIEASATESARFGTNYIGTEHILYALLSERDCVAVRLLESEGIPASELISDLNAYINSSVKQDRQSHRSELRSLPDEKTKIKGSPILSTYGRDLTELARDGRLDPTVGREKLTENGFSSLVSEVSIIKITHKVGALQSLLKKIDQSGVNIEYMYGLSIEGDDAYVVLKASDIAKLDTILAQCGIETITGEEIVKS